MPEGAEDKGHDKPEIAIFPANRFFTLTGRHLDGTPDELANVTEALAELAHEVASMSAANGATAKLATEAPPVDLGGLPQQLRELVETDDKLGVLGDRPKLSKGGDGSASGLDYSLVNHLAWRGQPDELIETALRHYPHGQVGSGKVTGGNAVRRVERLPRRPRRCARRPGSGARPRLGTRSC